MKGESRPQLWYGKYEYRANFYLPGTHLSYNSKSFAQYLKHLERLLNTDTKNSWARSTKNMIAAINLDAMERWFEWRIANSGVRTSLGKKVLIRIDLNNLAVYSNDLPLLETLSDIDPNTPIALTKAVLDVPTGTKYFVKAPVHKYRLYLKGNFLPINSTFRQDLKEFVERYKGTTTTMVVGRALDAWFNKSQGHWSFRRIQPYYSIDYDEPSTYSLLCLMFNQHISHHLKLEKRPGSINTP